MPVHFPDDLPPEEIERRSFAAIAAELGDVTFPPGVGPVVTRVIHATADFDFARALHFSEDALSAAVAALRRGTPIVTDTEMARAGVNQRLCRRLGVTVHCFIRDADVAAEAARDGSTRSAAAAGKAASICGDAVYVVGNAPTALVRLARLILGGSLSPRLVVGVPVGFVNVVESKELLLRCPVPHIVSTGRKGGSTVAAAICNALLLLASREGEAAS